MPNPPDFFRDFGILPEDVQQPPETVRAYFSGGHKFGQYLATAIMAGFGLGMVFLALKVTPFPGNVLWALLPIAIFSGLIYFVTRNDYAWVELDGATLRAKHLYTGRIVERPIEEIDDLLTLVFLVNSPATMLVEAWLGRIRGFMIRFKDKCTPLQVCRTDPAMKNAKELMEAIVYRMSEKGEVDAEIIDLEGEPLVRRIFWKDKSI